MKIAEDLEGVATRRFRNEPGDLPAVPDQDDLFLIPLQGIEDRAEIPGDIRDRESFHVEALLSDSI